MELPILPNSYSTRALQRDCDELYSARASNGAMVSFYVQKENHYACAVNAEAGPEGRHEVITKMEFNQDRDGLISVSRFFEDDTYQQVELVATDRRVRNSGIATALYELLVRFRSLKIVSDSEQYEGGKAIWQKLAERGKVSVYIYDTEAEEFFAVNGTRVKYDGSNIPEATIWSTDPNREKEHILLTACYP
ncbi:hypothetical protein LRP50_10760 [Enterovibrio sp. ZSDZ42]|uniref:N-acetyltransferase domain-containing protein n=1 Tax=Enterovibrio gelatinilyticus TaxID=2899819 RepID=A0ABT5R007_9GAMM|nr:hypothetical protein [Enterovibrio sp. ZSDZ42]MDD1793609.1 hypothetical protein [Enterovibrio sp. ZSDZ42]